jgi:pimeloyl-ACP methyl ester carboxylesterase
MSYDLHTSDIIQFIDYLNLNNLKVLGYSDGGVVALKLAIGIPEKIKKMVVVGANKSVDDLENDMIDFAKLMASDKNMSDSYIRSQKDKFIKLNPEPDKYERFIKLVGQMWLREPYITSKDYESIKTPLLLIFGDRDAVKFDKMIEMYKDLKCDKKQLCILPNADHFVFQDKHSEIINPIIIKYLRIRD